LLVALDDAKAGRFLRRRRCKSSPIPIVVNGKVGKEDRLIWSDFSKPTTMYGVLYNRRSFEESSQSQALISSASGVPYSSTFIPLSKPILKLPAYYHKFADPPGTNSVGIYKITGKVRRSKKKDGIVLDFSKAEQVRIDSDVVKLTKEAFATNWPRIANHATPEYLDVDAPVKLGAFVKPIEPVVTTTTIDGKCYLFACAEGRAYLSWHGECRACVYCLIDVEKMQVKRFYVTSASYGLE